MSIDITRNIKDKVSDKIQGMVVDLIPEEVWKELVSKEVDAFFTPPKPNTFGDKGTAAGLIREIIQEQLSKQVREELAKPKYRGEHTGWGEDGYQTFEPGEMVQQAIRENMPKILELVANKFVGGMMQATVDEMQQRLNNQQGTY